MFLNSIEIVMRYYIVPVEELTERCARYVELRHLQDEAHRIITSNIMFRFFYIVYGDRGFVKETFKSFDGR